MKLFDKACDEILASSKLEKVLGIINILENQLIGKTPDKEKTPCVSFVSLTRMLNEVKASLGDSLPTKTYHSQPFLTYALAKIKSSDPSLLNLKKEMPLLTRASQELDNFYAELEELEGNLEDFRLFALSMSLPKGPASKNAANTDESDFYILEASSIGTAVVDFYLKMEGLYQTVEATERAFEVLCARFSHGDHGRDLGGGVTSNPDASTIIEYASFTCPHCASFHANTFKQLKADYIDTGKINFIYRDVYFDRYGLWAAIVARCGEGAENRFFGIADMIYGKQREWASSSNSPQQIVDQLRTIGKTAGLTDAQLDTCFSDGDNAQALYAFYLKNAEADGINSTPSFVIDGRKYSNMSYDEMKDVIDAALGS